MLRILLSFLLFFGFSNAEKKKILHTRVISDDKTEERLEVEVSIEDDVLKLTIEKDGEIKKIEVDLDDLKALEVLEEIMDDMDIDINLNTVLHDDKDCDNHGAYLGVQLQDLTDQLRIYFKVKDNVGVLISEVVEDSPADKAGLKAGDVIIRINDQEMHDSWNLSQSIRDYDPGSEVILLTIREGIEKKFSVTLGERETSPWMAMLEPDHLPGDFMQPKMKKRFKMFKHRESDDLQDDDFRRRMPFPMHKDLEELREEIEELKEEVEKLKQK